MNVKTKNYLKMNLFIRFFVFLNVLKINIGIKECNVGFLTYFGLKPSKYP